MAGDAYKVAIRMAPEEIQTAMEVIRTALEVLQTREPASTINSSGENITIMLLAVIYKHE